MGITGSRPLEPEEIIVAREYRSELILEQRKRRHKVITGMFQKALSSPAKTKLETMPIDIFFLILRFLTPELPTLLAINSKIHLKILETLDSAFSKIESQFALIHSNLFCFKRSFSDFTRMIVSDQKGTRIDRVIVAEILPYLNGKTIKIRYIYRQNHKNYYQKAEYKVDCISQSKRSIWAHRDECKFHGEDVKRAYTQQIPLISCGDNIEIAINWYNLSGNINLDTIQWQTPVIQETKTILKNLQIAPKFVRGPQNDSEGITKKLYLYNVSRHCELELSQTEWYDANYYIKPGKVFSYDFFSPFLKLVSSEFAGVDVTVSRNTYRAERVGIVPDSLAKIGIVVEIKPKGEELDHEVKRVGLVYDRHKPIELSVGDSFILYISRGG